MAKIKNLTKILSGEDTWIDKLEKKFITNPPTPPGATWDEWDSIRSSQKSNHPVAFVLYHDIPIFFGRLGNRLNNILYWFKYRLVKKHKYHLVDTKLSPGYYDYDTRLLHATFSLFVEFVEEQNQWSKIKDKIKMYTKLQIEKNWEEWERTKNKKFKIQQKKNYKLKLQMWQDFQELYTWWTKDRQLERDKLNKEFDRYYAKQKTVANKKYTDKKYNEINLLYDKEELLNQKDDAQLKKLVTYRRNIWV